MYPPSQNRAIEPRNPPRPTTQYLFISALDKILFSCHPESSASRAALERQHPRKTQNAHAPPIIRQEF
jgi:hypothetical protein